MDMPYRSAPHNTWSLGVIPIDLSCSRNPWHEAIFDDPSYLAFTKDSNFLTEKFPISEEVHGILRWIFDPDPSARIRIAELLA